MKIGKFSIFVAALFGLAESSKVSSPFFGEDLKDSEGKDFSYEIEWAFDDNDKWAMKVNKTITVDYSDSAKSFWDLFEDGDCIPTRRQPSRPNPSHRRCMHTGEYQNELYKNDRRVCCNLPQSEELWALREQWDINVACVKQDSI